MHTDLHTHTTESDGALTPSELIALARENGVARLAITDHDTVGAYSLLPEQDAVDVIPGVELSVLWNGRTIHIVGLNFDLDDRGLTHGLASQSEARIERARKIASRLARLGTPDWFETVMERSGGTPGRPHFAQLLVEAEFVKDVAGAFKRYLGAGKPGDVKSAWAPLDEAVGWIRAAGGNAVVAHPAKYAMTNTKLGCLIRDFKAAGGDAIEIVCGQQDPGVTAKLERWCHELDMTASCGSDFHTPANSWSSPGRFLPPPQSITPVWDSWQKL